MAEEITQPGGALNEVALRTFIQRELGVREIRDVRLLVRLIMDGALPKADAEEFILAAQSRGRSLLDHAISSEIAIEAEVLKISAELYELAAVAIEDVEIEEGLAHLLRPEQARTLAVLPYSRTSEGELLVAIDDASRKDVIEQQLRTAMPKERIAFRLASRTSLETMIDRTYRSGPVADAADYSGGGDSGAVTLVARNVNQNDPVVRLFTDLLTQAATDGASDIHFEPRESGTSMARFRVDGKLFNAMEIPAGLSLPIAAYIKNIAGMNSADRRTPQDGRFSQLVGNRKIDLRVVSIPVVSETEGTEGVVLRLLDPNRALLTLEELGMTKGNFERYSAAILQPYGFALTCGPTGSGKSTTLYASLQMVNTSERKVMTIEDPVELRLPGITQIEVPRAGDDRWGFAEALPKIVRSDPDVVMVGEIRDSVTANLAVNAALTGHFVYSTLHTNDAVGAVVRLREMDVEPVLIAETLEIVVAQRLIRRVCSCSEDIVATADYLRALYAPADAIKFVEEGGELILKEAAPNGCSICKGRGYKGRTGVHEVLVVGDEFRNAVVNRAEMRELKRIARESGMRTLREDGWTKVKAGFTTLDDLNHWVKPDRT